MMQDINLYYESLKPVYDQIEEWSERRTPLGRRIINGLRSASVVVFALSLFPLLPVGLTFLLSATGLTLGPIDLSQPTLVNFLVVWVILTFLTWIMFFVMGKIYDRSSSGEPSKPPQALTLEQLTFIAIYESYKELKIHFISHLDQRAENSLVALERATTYSIYDYVFFDEDDDFSHHATLVEQVSIAQEFLRTFEQYAWFKLDTITKSYLQALISFPEKVTRRLKRGEDLPTILGILENLSKLVYAYLPEHKAYMDPESLVKLQSEGLECLEKFVNDVNDLTHFQPQVEKSKQKEQSWHWVKKLSSYYQNIGIRFMIWFVILLVVTSVIVWIFNRFIMVLSNDIIATLIIPTSVGGATVLTAFVPPIRKSSNNTGLSDREE